MQIEVGAIVEGKVTGLTNFGAFVTLEGNTTGMVHISEVSNTYVKDIKEHLSEGQQVKVKVLSIGADGKISLSIKQANPTVQQSAPAQQHKPRTNHSRPNVWQGQPQQSSNEPASFEDMMAKFKQVSDDKFSDLRRSNDSRYSQTSSRRGNRK
ncbi:MAG: S1 RNA-binding domain-containing protein [Clostridia bacterium]|nr:S1 RNA-binding domain-containing protein [Clostridia bacterium]